MIPEIAWIQRPRLGP